MWSGKMINIFSYIRNFFLCKKYPFLQIRNVWHGEKYGYEFTELDSLPRGWKKKFGIKISKDLLILFRKSATKNFHKQYRISQIKEKYGSLRWYDNRSSRRYI